MRVSVAGLCLCLVLGCGSDEGPEWSPGPGSEITNSEPTAGQTLKEARAGFTTTLVSTGDFAGAADVPPPNGPFELIRYQSPVGPLAAYVTKDPGDGVRQPAIVWITGGDNNSIGDIWSPYPRGNDQSASAFRRAGIVMMFPSQRGGNDNPGRREGFLGEADDILAATDHLASLPYVDPDRIYLGGHSTGGTMVLIVAECSGSRYRGVFSLGPVARADHYGGDFLYCNPNDAREVSLRSPLDWLGSIESPTFVFEGARGGNWDSIEVMQNENTNPNVAFFRVGGHDHFTVIAPVAELLAGQITRGNVNVTRDMVTGLR